MSIVTASALAAAIVVAVAWSSLRTSDRSTNPVNTAPRGVVSVQVPAGKTAIVLQTKDPGVTVVWLSNNSGGGL